MGRLGKSSRLNIWMNGVPVGLWEIGRNGARLSYFDEWLNSDVARPLSLSLPFLPGNAPHQGPVVTDYFDNLLPDNPEIRRRLAQRHRAESADVFPLLAKIGRDCVGAIQLLPEHETPSDIFKIDGTPLNGAGVAQQLRDTTSSKVFGQSIESDGDLRLSIAGAQEKTAFLYHQGQWHLPKGSTPTTHIFKLPLGLVGQMQADMRTSVENEWLCMKIVEAFGLPAAQCEIATFEDQKALIVKRFDRTFSSDGSWIVRLPQEDFCQATGTSPLRKYQSDGGPGITQIMSLLLGSSCSAQDRRDFFKAQIVFFLLAATDGHAKNFSVFLLPNTQYRLTPFYDVLSAHPVIGKEKNQISPMKAKLAMAVRGSTNHYLLSAIQRRHWIKQGQHVGFASLAVEQMIEEIVGQLDSVLAEVSRLLPNGFPLDVVESIFEGMRRQTKRLLGDQHD